MSVNEGFIAQDPKLTQLSADPNVRIPDHVKAAAAAGEALHKAAYPPPEPEPASEPAPAPVPEPAPAPQPGPEPQPAPQEQHPAPSAEDKTVTAEEWRHRFLSMQGRYNAGQRTIGSMEEQMGQLGQELVRTQQILAQVQASPVAASQQAPRGHGNENLITDADREAYGDELISLARRAGLEAVTPEIERLRADNERLTQRVQHTGRRELFATMDGAIPNWRQINVSPQFKSWLRLPNVYTGALRGNMLKAAVDGAEAPKVIALFKDFLAEAHATGQQAPTAQIEQQQSQPAPREPALALETLAAPGRARPASGDSQVPADKPNYSRANITKFYDDKRRGLYAGRETEAAAFERDLEAAQREGRIRG